jgi:hypothetical protein
MMRYLHWYLRALRPSGKRPRPQAQRSASGSAAEEDRHP